MLHPLDSFKPVVTVTVEYTSAGKRVSRKFPDAIAARRFYLTQARKGNSPKIASAVQESPMAKTVAQKTEKATKSTMKAGKASTETVGKIAEVPAETAKKGKKTPAPKPTAAAKPSTNGHKPIKNGTKGTIVHTPEAGVPWSAKRIAIVKAMQDLGAIGSGNGASAATIAKKAGLEPHEVKHYCYKDGEMAVCGYIQCEVHEETGNLLHYVLTKKGAKLDPKTLASQPRK